MISREGEDEVEGAVGVPQAEEEAGEASGIRDVGEGRGDDPAISAPETPVVGAAGMTTVGTAVLPDWMCTGMGEVGAALAAGVLVDPALGEAPGVNGVTGAALAPLAWFLPGAGMQPGGQMASGGKSSGAA